MSSKKRQYVYSIKDLPQTPLQGDILTRFLLSENLLISFIEQPPGAVFDVHTHECEQILIILEGEEEHEVDGETIIMRPGDVCVHPANVPHAGRTPKGFKGIDIFSPPRTSHVELMKKFGTYPDANGVYPKK